MIGRLRNQAVFSIADQAMFSGAMLVVNILLARWTSPDEYGAFAVLFAIFLILAGLHNALIVEPMSVYGPRKDSQDRTAYVRHVYLMHSAVALALAAIACVVALFLGDGALQDARWALPLTVPLAMTFWLTRRTFYIEARPDLALLLTSLYAVSVMAGLTWLYRTESLSAFSAFIVFGVAGFFVSLPAILRACLGRPSTTTQTFGTGLREHANYGRWSFGESIAFALGASVLPLAIAYFMTVGDAGKFRALQILFLPLTHLLTGLGLMLLPMMSQLRMSAVNDEFVVRAKVMLSFFTALAVVYAALILVFGRDLLMLLYGSSEYLDLMPLLPYLALNGILVAATAGMMIVMRSSERPDLVFVATVVGSIAMLTVGIAMIAVYGLPGIAVAMLLNTGTTAAVLAYSGRHLFYGPTRGIRQRASGGANV